MHQTVVIPNVPKDGVSDEEQELRDEADAYAADHWHEPDFQHQMLSDLAVVTWEGFMHNNLLENFTTVETVGEFERITMEDVRGLSVNWVSQGGYLRESTIDRRVWELERDQIGYHVTEPTRAIRSGFSKWFDQMVRLAPTQLRAEVNARLFRTWQAAIGPASPYYFAGAGVSLATVNTFITEVGDTITDDEGFAIVGRKSMTDQIMDEIQSDNQFMPETQEEIRRTGRLGEYRGATIVELKNHRDRFDRPFFPSNEMWILAKSASKVGMWGGMTAQNWDDVGGRNNHHETGWMETGFACIPGLGLARRIIDTEL